MVVLTSRSGRAAARLAGRRPRPRARGERFSAAACCSVASRRSPWPRPRAAATRRARRRVARRPRDRRPPAAAASRSATACSLVPLAARRRTPRARPGRAAAAFCSAASPLASRSSRAASSRLASATASSASAALRWSASACCSCPSSTRSSLPLTAPATSLALPFTPSRSPSRACAAWSVVMLCPFPLCGRRRGQSIVMCDARPARCRRSVVADQSTEVLQHAPLVARPLRRGPERCRGVSRRDPTVGWYRTRVSGPVPDRCRHRSGQRLLE